MSALKPLADYLHRFHMPKPLSVLIVYLGFIILLAATANAVIPPLVSQSIRLAENFPEFISTFIPFMKFDVQLLVQQIAPIGQNLIKVTFGIFSDIIALVTVFVISFYLIIERENLQSHLSMFMGEETAKKIMDILHKVEIRLGAWVRGQVALMAIIGLFTFIGLTILQIPYVFPLAIIAGILELVPTIGPIISAVPAVLVGLTISPLYALITACLYFFIQQLENQVVVPYIMRKTVGLPPLVTLISLLIGWSLAGISGAILALPVVLTIETVFSEYLKIKESNQK